VAGATAKSNGPPVAPDEPFSSRSSDNLGGLDMLQRLNPVKVMTGLELARNGFSKSQRAAHAASIPSGELILTDLTQKQLAKLFGVSVPYIREALAQSPANRQAMRKGCLKIAGITTPSKSELERTIARAGVEPTWQALLTHMEAQSK
jgi:hypothetical protein